MIENKSEQFLVEKFRNFYEQHRVEQPPAVEKREFGFGVFKRKIADRHLAFRNYNELNAFLREEVPFYLSYSSAYYRFPEAQPMSEKGLQGADLVYEFDVDDFKLDCQQGHNFWRCPQCAAEGKGNVQHCTSCSSKTLVEEWVCPECMKAVKEQVMKLVDVLRDTFSFQDFSVNYSGAKGFHVHVRSSSVQQFPHSARVELVNFLMGQGIEMENVLALSPQQSKGWGKKAWSALDELLRKADADSLAGISGSRSKECGKWLEERERILSDLKSGKRFPWLSKKNHPAFWKSLFEHVMRPQFLPIDRQTSIDIAKIVRCPETLHGGTGLVAKIVPLEQLASFDPLSQAIGFSTQSTVKLAVSKTPKFFLAGQWWGPFENEILELPEAVAVYLLARGSAEVK
ncbi:MAG: DNA primase small subunit domain-containing protein [Candidatus Diapherotrites archaeon]